MAAILKSNMAAICCSSNWYSFISLPWKGKEISVASKISIVCHLEADTMTELCFYLRPFWKFKCSPTDTFPNVTVIFLDPENICLDAKVLIVSLTCWDIDRNIFIWPSSWKSNMAAICGFSKWVVFLDHEDIYLGTKISIVCHLEGIMIEIDFNMTAILKIQLSRHKYCERHGKIFFSIQHVVMFFKMVSFPNIKKNERNYFPT